MYVPGGVCFIHLLRHAPKIYDAFYRLTDPQAQIRSYVYDVVRSESTLRSTLEILNSLVVHFGVRRTFVCLRSFIMLDLTPFQLFSLSPHAIIILCSG